MTSTTVLLTCTGGRFAADIVEALRADDGLGARVVGTDADPGVLNQLVVDAFHPLPLAAEEPDAFLAELRTIVEEEGVDAVLPGSDEEALVLARGATRSAAGRPAKGETSERSAATVGGAAVAVAEAKTVELVRDKARLFEHLADAGLDLPPFGRVDGPDDLEDLADEAGYPDRCLVLKPATGRGARGLVLVDPDAGAAHVEPRGRDILTGDLASVKEHLDGRSAPWGLVGMEHLEGPAFDVDVVARAGEPLCLVPRQRLWDDPFSPASQGCRIERHPGVEELARDIVGCLGLDHVVDLDVGLAADGRPGLFEVNPRMSGAVAAALAGGVNVPAIAVRNLLGMELPGKLQPEEGRCMFPSTRMLFTDRDPRPDAAPGAARSPPSGGTADPAPSREDP